MFTSVECFSCNFSITFSEWSVRLLLPVRTSATQLSVRTWPHPIYGHIPKGEHTCSEQIGTLRAHVKSLYVTSIVVWIMKRYERRIYLAIRLPACVTCARCAAVSDRYPHNALDRSVGDGIDRQNRCTCAKFCGDISRRSCIVYSPPPYFISSEKRKGDRKTFTRAIYAWRGARRHSEERVSVGADTWRLVSVACHGGGAPCRRRPASLCIWRDTIPISTLRWPYKADVAINLSTVTITWLVSRLGSCASALKLILWRTMRARNWMTNW